MAIAAGALDQRSGHALIVVEQNLQNMFGGELLVALRKRIGLGGLNETAHPLGVFFDIHTDTSMNRPALIRHRPMTEIELPQWQAPLSAAFGICG